MLNVVMKFVARVWQLTEAPYREVLFDTPLQYRRLLRLLPFFYAWVLYVGYKAYKGGRALEPPLDGPLWPLFWMDWVPWKYAGIGVLVLLAVGGIAAICRPRAQWARVMAFLGIFYWFGMIYSHIGIQHRTYTMLTLCFFLALMPNLPHHRQAGEDARRRALLIAFGGVTFILFTYSWAGFLKLWGIVESIVLTNDIVFDFDIIPLNLLNRAYQYEKPLLLSEFVINHPGLSKLGFFAAVYIEFVSVAAAFRVHLNRWWFAVLVSFHYMTLYSMGVFFSQATGVVFLLFCLTPFSRASLNWRAVIGELPWFGPFLSAALYRLGGFGESRERLWVYANPDCRLAQAVVAHARQASTCSGLSFEDRHGPRLSRLIEDYPGVCDGRGLVALSERDGERRVRFDAEAALFLSAGIPGRAGWAFLLLLIPLPLTQVIYRGVARRRAEESSHHLDTESS